MIDKTYLKVRYAETDQMGIVYYANYFVWMEVGRTNLIRNFGITYKKLEEMGILLPVVEARARYISPTYYDDDVIVYSCLVGLGRATIDIGYKIFRKLHENKEELACVGFSRLIFMDKKTNKPIKVPEFFREKVTLDFQKQEIKFFMADLEKYLFEGSV